MSRRIGASCSHCNCVAYKRRLSKPLGHGKARHLETHGLLRPGTRWLCAGAHKDVIENLPITSQVGKLESMISSLDDLKLEPQYPQSRNIMRPANTEELNAARVLDEDESPTNVSLNSQDK